MQPKTLLEFLSSNWKNILGIYEVDILDQMGKAQLRDSILYFWNSKDFELTMIFSDFQEEKYKIFLEYLDIQKEKKYSCTLFCLKNTPLEDFRGEVAEWRSSL